MATNEQDVENLVAIGLTITQAKVYLTLAHLGTAKAKAIWKDSEVARQDIYRVLSELEQKTLVEKIFGALLPLTCYGHRVRINKCNKRIRIHAGTTSHGKYRYGDRKLCSSFPISCWSGGHVGNSITSAKATNKALDLITIAEINKMSKQQNYRQKIQNPIGFHFLFTFIFLP